VEHVAGANICAICADERQWVPVSGQVWTTLDELRASGTTVEVVSLEPGLHGLTASPGVGIGQQSKLLVTRAGNLLWDPIGYLDDAAVGEILALGSVAAIAASHPHMFGVQVEWSSRLGGRRSTSTRRTSPGLPARIRRSGPGRGGTSCFRELRSRKSVVTFREALSSISRRRTGRVCSSRVTQSS